MASLTSSATSSRYLARSTAEPQSFEEFFLGKQVRSARFYLVDPPVHLGLPCRIIAPISGEACDQTISEFGAGIDRDPQRDRREFTGFQTFQPVGDALIQVEPIGFPVADPLDSTPDLRASSTSCSTERAACSRAINSSRSSSGSSSTAAVSWSMVILPFRSPGMGCGSKIR
jgi:hypothetical protein